jgi:membrane protein YqaA with SNARE-associated domain
MNRLNKKKIVGVLTVVVTIGLSLLLISIPTDKLLNNIGTDNAYVFMYLVAFLGSITTFASIPYPLILIGLVAAGMDPLIIGVVSALGVITSDSVTFFVSKKGQILLSKKLQIAFDSLAKYIKKYPRLLTPGLVVYGTVSPLSNDFAVISLSLMKYKYFRVIPPLAIGNILYNVGLAFLGVYAYHWIIGIF